MSAPHFRSREEMAEHLLERVKAAARRNARVRALRGGPDVRRSVVYGAYAKLMEHGDALKRLSPALRRTLLRPWLSVGNVQLRLVDSPRWQAFAKLHGLLFELSDFWSRRELSTSKIDGSLPSTNTRPEASNKIN